MPVGTGVTDGGMFPQLWEGSAPPTAPEEQCWAYNQPRRARPMCLSLGELGAVSMKLNPRGGHNGGATSESTGPGKSLLPRGVCRC